SAQEPLATLRSKPSLHRKSAPSLRRYCSAPTTPNGSAGSESRNQGSSTAPDTTPPIDPYSAAKPPTAHNPRQPPCQLQAFPLKAYSLSLPLTSSRPRLEVPLTFLFFHRSRLIVVDHAALTLGSTGQQHFLDDFRQGGGGGFHRAGQRVAAQGPEAHHLHFRYFAGVQRHALVVDHDQRAVTLDHRAFGGEVQGYDRDAFQIDVLPDVQLGPVGQGEYADALALVHLAVVDVPQFRALVFRVPAMVLVTEG